MPGVTVGRVRCLAALAQGELIGPDAWTGEVLSVHARAINVLRADGLVVSLVARVESMTAMSVCVPRFFDVPPQEGAVGRAVVGDAQRIEIAGVAGLLTCRKLDVERDSRSKPASRSFPGAYNGDPRCAFPAWQGRRTARHFHDGAADGPVYGEGRESPPGQATGKPCWSWSGTDTRGG